MKLTPAMFAALCKQSGLPKPESEVRFHPTRKWRWDYCWPTHKLALEQQGGVWSGGKHGRGSGIVKDMEKYSNAAALGWRVILVTPSDLAKPETLDLIRTALTFTVRPNANP